jgi:hypothetical protein
MGTWNEAQPRLILTNPSLSTNAALPSMWRPVTRLASFASMAAPRAVEAASVRVFQLKSTWVRLDKWLSSRKSPSSAGTTPALVGMVAPNRLYERSRVCRSLKGVGEQREVGGRGQHQKQPLL